MKRLTFFATAIIAIALFTGLCPAQDVDMEFTLDTASSTIPLPKIFSPNIDLSGRGFNGDIAWPQSLAATEVLNRWQKEIGFRGMYRLQYNLWEISQLHKNHQLQEELLANYEAAIKKINDGGGVVILDIFSMPQGQGKVLDKKSSPVDVRAFKALIKSYMRELSCVKKYNIWYEVWTAPDLDVFFLGRQQEYLALYRAVAEAAKELESQTRIHIPVGGPSTTWWFRNIEGNTVVTPERSLIYDLIKFCYHYRLPLDFISWHAYTADPKSDKEATTYNKPSVALIRDWLSYFNFPKDTPLIVDEWNYDSGTNVVAERKEKAYVAASFIPARLKNMYEADITNQLYFCLEDFQDNKEGVARNVGAFWYQQTPAGYTGGSKAIYNVLQMVRALNGSLYVSPSKINDEFVGMLATRQEDSFAILIYNYIDPDIFKSYISRNVASLGDGERKALVGIVRSDKFDKIRSKELDIITLRVPGKVKNLLKKALEVAESAKRFSSLPRELKLGINNLKSDYLYTRYTVDPSCGINCEFYPREEKVIPLTATGYSEKITLTPYSVQLILLKPKPEEPKPALVQPSPETGQPSQPAEGVTEKPAAVVPKEAPSAGVPQEEPAAVVPKEAPSAGVPKEKPAAVLKETPAAVAPKENPESSIQNTTTPASEPVKNVTGAS